MRVLRTVCGRLAIAFGVALGIALGAGAVQAETAPRRVVSFNLCADQLVVALADPGQIAGLSPYASDPALSVVADKARAFRKADWQAESTLLLEPDLVLVGPNDRSVTRRMLTSQGLRVVETGFVSDLNSARKQIREIAALLGHPERGEAMIADLERARARLAAVAPEGDRTALVVERGGYTQGPASLAATLLAEAGLKPPAGAPAGYGGFIPLEKFLVLKPDFVFLKDPPNAATDQGALFLVHPALRELYPPERRVALPTRYTMCGGPALIAAFDYMADEIARLPAP
ncbi:ABC transporter substrate-binding protein [Pseudorhodoplanes sp.]|uniref:ABC transporter substrate-binding protein n=1 Tax=Pseudorhodoplanes sp. TaxID=1934341 RepID=UPI002C2F53B2|nr:ABC transporter substrate-binding protein [Pseudorhodoplanes sp.]HWV42945.1 ABC transporter substrate-binding protein [Pseudorhodoplanes sp.]